MSSIRHVVPHDLSPSSARQVTERAFAHYREHYGKYDPQLSWRTETEARVSFGARGIEIGGTIELLSGRVAFELDVPMVFLIFRSRAVAIVEREVRRWCAEGDRPDVL